MRGSSGIITILLAVCLLLSLSACGREADTESTEAPAVTAAPDASPFDVPGEDARQDEAGTVQFVTDGLDGRYYNDYLRMTLVLDGAGGCALTGGGAGSSGTYTAAEGGLTLDFDTGRETAVIDGDGDITIEGRVGYFLRDWDLWGITEDEAGGTDPVPSPQIGTIDNGDGTLRYRDPKNGVAFTYPADMTVLRDTLIAGTAVSDGESGCVTGRNVTELYSTHNGTDDEFVEDYIRSFVFADFEMLYGGLAGYDALTILHEGIEGRLAAATLALRSVGSDEFIQAKVIFYTSTYADGTVNYICKTVFAPQNRLEALESSVTDMGAVRLQPD